MPNIRESLYQCLANEVSVVTPTPMIELCTTESDAYAITIYVVYNGTSFLELNLNSGKIKTGNKLIGYYRIRQAALQDGELDNLYLQNKTYYLYLSNVDTTKKIYIRKEIKFGTYSKLLSGVSTKTEEDLENNKLTSIAFDNYNPDKAYSNGYFVESNDHTYVKQLLSKDSSGILGERDIPFENAYVTTITTNSILNSNQEYRLVTGVTQQTFVAGRYYTRDENGVYSESPATTFTAKTQYYEKISAEKLNIGTEEDKIESVNVETINVEDINASGAMHYGSNILLNDYEPQTATQIKDGYFNIKPNKSGFDADGFLNVRLVDGNHIYTEYEDIDEEGLNGEITKVRKQKLTVPGGIKITGVGDFTTAYIGKLRLYNDANVGNGKAIENAGENAQFAVQIDKEGNITSISLANPNKTDENTNTLRFVTSIQQTDAGKVSYNTKTVSVRDVHNTEDEYKKYPVNSLAITNAINKLDYGPITPTAAQTITKIQQTDGIISVTVGDIAINQGAVSVTEKDAITTYPYGDSASDAEVVNLAAALARRARKVHGHGFITNDGKLIINNSNYESVKAAETGGRLLITDADGNILGLTDGFNTANNNKFMMLNQQGKFQMVSLSTLNAAFDKHYHGSLTLSGKLLGSGIIDNATGELNANSADDDVAAEADFKLAVTNGSNILVRSNITIGTSTNKYLAENGTWQKVPDRDDLGAAHDDHKHDDRYVRFDDSQSITDAQKTQARSNIGAGTVTSVKLESAKDTNNNSVLSITNDTVSTSGTITIGLPGLITPGTDNVNLKTAVTSNSVLSYDNSGNDSSTYGYKIVTPFIAVDTYGRATSVKTSYTQTIPGHTADYSLSEDGILTITVR